MLRQLLIDYLNAQAQAEKDLQDLQQQIEALTKLTKPSVIPEWKQRFYQIYESSLVHYAMRTPYKFGAEWHNDRAFDCSAFMQLIYGLWGIVLPRTSIKQSEIGSALMLEDIREGDLLFFDTNGKATINHVGMYIGQGEMIHANNVTDGVNIKSVLSDPWRKRIVTIRRVL